MAFNIYADEKMQTLFAAANNGNRLLHIDSNKAEQIHDFVFYFGNPQSGTKLQAAQNSGTDQITLSVVNVLPVWGAEKDVIERDVVGMNGFIFMAQNSGKTGKTAPSWLNVAGSNTADATVTWRCLGKSHAPAEIQLALSKDGLANATSSVNLGTTIPSGAAVAVYMRVTNKVADLYTLPAAPQLQLRLNETVETAA